ncbi:RNA ligase family protein [Rhodococcoides fascians]|uniref:RNA ligase family protein n=1 Tax=Rhodococcoides fascians TaxID=1828 RepID=UPI00050BE319|nr:RNA ligase family protein [Rhodococcus fascians]
MKLTAPENENYAAVVVQINTILDLPNSDFLAAIPMFGYQIISSKNVFQTGHLALFIPAEAQLDHDFASTNDMYRHAELNADQNVTGYLEDNRRVRAIKLRGNRSDALLMPLSSLLYTGIDPTELQVGDTFDTINGHPICRKYYPSNYKAPSAGRNGQMPAERTDAKFLPRHFDTPQYFRCKDQISPFENIVVTQKLHGTSIRLAHTIVPRPLTLRDRIAKRLGVKVQDTEYDYVSASRGRQKQLTDDDIWTQWGERLRGRIPAGFIVYGEIIGWHPDGKPVQKGYTYRLPIGASDLYVYRVVQVTTKGRATDLSWDQMVEFCAEVGIETVPALYRGRHDFIEIESYMDKRLSETLPFLAVPLEEGTKKNPIVDEGVCVRVEGLTPQIFKAKSPLFFQFETKQLDADIIDTETAEALVAA